ncbi:hypothetical protein [Streptomyces atratus]|uniref:hypothetical protein n=1 Tax=Streptomyces atratus TaxID=1893 RepID=UPI0033EF2EC7
MGARAPSPTLFEQGRADRGAAAESGIATDARGLAVVDAGLRSVSHPWVLGVPAKPVSAGVALERATINAEPGLLITLGGQPIGIVSLDVADGLIQHLRFQLDPDRLRGVQGGRAYPTWSRSPGGDRARPSGESGSPAVRRGAHGPTEGFRTGIGRR